MAELQTGRISAIHDTFGFIVTDSDGASIFFHQSSLVAAHLRDLRRNDRVSFIERMGDRGVRAEHVERIDDTDNAA